MYPSRKRSQGGIARAVALPLRTRYSGSSSTAKSHSPRGHAEKSSVLSPLLVDCPRLFFFLEGRGSIGLHTLEEKMSRKTYDYKYRTGYQ